MGSLGFAGTPVSWIKVPTKFLTIYLKNDENMYVCKHVWNPLQH